MKGSLSPNSKRKLFDTFLLTDWTNGNYFSHFRISQLGLPLVGKEDSNWILCSLQRGKLPPRVITIETFKRGLSITVPVPSQAIALAGLQFSCLEKRHSPLLIIFLESIDYPNTEASNTECREKANKEYDRIIHFRISKGPFGHFWECSRIQGHRKRPCNQ